MPFSKNKQQVIRKSNDLIEARYSLNLGEQRLILLLAGEISPDDEDFKSYQIRVADFAKMFGLEASNSLYEKVQNAADSLVGKTLQLSTDAKVSKKTAWLSYVEYVNGSGLINLEFHSSLKPYLLQLKSHFTQYNSNYVMNFSCQYSVRIYELLKMNAYKAKNGQFEKYFELNKFRSFLDIDDNEYTLFSNLKNRVIQPAISEISDLTDLSIHDVKYGKTGRKITSVTFFVTVRTGNETNPQQANSLTDSIKPEKQTENHPVIESLVSLGFSLEIAKKYKNKHGVKKIERNIAYTLAKNQERNISDVPSYLNKAIENDYGNAWEIKQKKELEDKKQQDKLDQAKKTSVEKAKQERNAQNQKAFNDFLQLPENQQKELKKEFYDNTDSTVSAQIRMAEKRGVDIFTSPMVFSNFKIFLVDQKGF